MINARTKQDVIDTLDATKARDFLFAFDRATEIAVIHMADYLQAPETMKDGSRTPMIATVKLAANSGF